MFLVELKNVADYYSEESKLVEGTLDDNPFFLEDAVGASSAAFVAANKNRGLLSMMDPSDV